MNKAYEKASEIFDKYFSHQWQVHKTTRNYKMAGMSKSAALYFAIKEVEAIINLPVIWYSKEYSDRNDEEAPKSGTEEFWLDVKTELERM